MTENTTKRMLVDIVVMALYIGLPLLLSGLLGAAGFTIAKNMMEFKAAAMKPLSAIANTATGIGTGVIKTIASKGLSKLRR